MEVWTTALVCAVGFAANWFGIITGGSGLFTTGLMIMLGVPPVQAVANTRFSILGVDVTSIREFHAAKKIHYRLALPLAVVSGAVAYVSSRYLQDFDGDLLKKIIAGAMLFSIVLFLIFPRIGSTPGRPRGGAWAWISGGFLVGVSTAIATVTGGLAGMLYSYILVLVFGETFLESAGTRKIIAFALTLAAATTFVIEGLVDYGVAVPLLISSGLGGWFGSRFMIARGDKVVRWVFLAGVAVMAVAVLLHR
jgi:uncharacterized membrane protein YfcA